MSKPNDLSESSLLALNIIIGSCLVSGLDLKDLQKSIPDIFGIIQSKITKSGEFSSINSRASSPFLAFIQIKPELLRLKAINSN